MSKRTDWVVRVYKKDGEVLTAWIVPGMTEKEARDEAKVDVANAYPGRDWTLHLAKEMEGGYFEVELVGKVMVVTHADAVHDVLWHGVCYRLKDEFDFEGLERAVTEAIRDHLAERGVTDTEVDVFEDYLHAQGREMVEVEIDVK